VSDHEPDNIELTPESADDAPLLTPAEEAALAEATGHQEDRAEPEADGEPEVEAEESEPKAESDESDQSDVSGEDAECEDGKADTEDEKAPRKELPPESMALCKSAIEAMLFSCAEPLTSRKLADPLKEIGADGNIVRKIVRDLIKEYAGSNRGFAIEEVAGGFQMMTRPDYAEFVRVLHQSGGGRGRLSQAALETLAVVAYKQPVTRADIEAIRGVQAGPLLRTLLQKGLVKITGRAEVIGRPLLYGTTKKFLEIFGLKSLNELPKVEELPRP
jgi:segregation and condensation protein B